MIALDLATHFLISAFESDRIPSVTNPVYTDYTRPGPKTHYTTEGGGSYSMRPDLTRSGFSQALFAMAMSPAGMVTMAAGASAAAYYAETQNIQHIVGSTHVDTATKIHMLQGLTPY